jgi:glycosyltransferase involved in cell wall biosynthesis
MKNKLIIGIDASRNRSGGARAHLIGIINALVKQPQNSIVLHIWSYKSLLDSLPSCNYIIKHNPLELEKNLFRQLVWQFFKLPKEAQKVKCDILLYTDAGALVNFSPSVVMSRDMLSYEKGEMNRYGFSFSKLRLILLKHLQAYSLKKADGAIFLTEYASNVIQTFTGPIKNFKIIPHGVGDVFRSHVNKILKKTDIKNTNYKCIYVSNAAMYKHQWHVIKGIKYLRDQGYNLSLILVGGGTGPAQQKIDKEILASDPDNIYTKQFSFLNHNQLPMLIKEADIFIFASSCENMPNTLIEGMASGLPIACSNRGPMPEVLKNAGVYFNPEDYISIANSIMEILSDIDSSNHRSNLSIEYSKFYSWERCSNETIDFLYSTYNLGKYIN